ncbi:MAG: hypothetical protein O3A00_09880 [Planctomycetota bacterium]|nr:hypothetical protein [Planctomycetota bacterium]
MASRIPNPEWSESNSPSPVEFSDWDEMLAEREGAAFAPAPEFGVPPTLLETDSEVSVFIPKHYEAKYAYPLIIWLHSSGSDEHEIEPLMPEISERNYFGLAVRAPLASLRNDGHEWPSEAEDTIAVEDRIHDVVCQLRREFHIHSERLFLAGVNDTGTLALRLLLRQPSWFAGAILMNGRLPDLPQPLAAYRELMGKRVLVTRDISPTSPTKQETAHTAWLLHLAGMHVATDEFESEESLEPCRLRRIDHWIMDGISSAMFV